MNARPNQGIYGNSNFLFLNAMSESKMLEKKVHLMNIMLGCFFQYQNQTNQPAHKHDCDQNNT